jgi:hypothetical protein
MKQREDALPPTFCDGDGHYEELRRLAQSIIAERENEISTMRGAVGEPPSSQISDMTDP